MMRAMLWKEYREHRTIWLAMAMVNAGTLFGLTSLEELWGLSHREDKLLMLGPAAMLLVWVYGMVCGAMLLAGEREAATLDFLDALPVTRFRLWAVKGQIGLLLLGGQVLVLYGCLAALTPLGSQRLAQPLSLSLYALGMVVFGLVGLAWGLFFSARGENVLNTIGMALVGQIVIVIAANFLSLLAVLLWKVGSFGLIGRQQQRDPISGAAFGLLLSLVSIGLTLAAVAGSARIFSRPDRLRGREAEHANVRLPGASVWASWGRLLWLSYQQMRRLIVGIIAFALGLSLLLLVAGPMMWPGLTLLIGVLCGVTVFADEQLHGSFRFLGDQRFPLGRVWLVKVGMRFALAVFAAFLLMLPSLILAIIDAMEPIPEPRPPFFGTVLHSVLVGPVVPVGIHLTMWLLYGFSVGHLCGLLFRKSLVAGVVALGGSALLVSLWVPSLFGIGLHFWQVAGAPVILLGAAWLLMPAWAADRLATRGTFVRLGAALAAAGLWTAGGLWYRVAEVPDVPDRFDMPAFVARLPSMDDNEAGQAIRGAWSAIDKLTNPPTERPGAKPLPPNGQAENALPNAQVEEVLEDGWPAREIELGDWLDQQFQQEDQEKWLRPLTRAADCPVGVVEYVKNMTFDDRLGKWHNTVVLFNQLLAVRGLQLQSRGDQKTFVDYLRIGLAISRNLQNLSPPVIALKGRDVERVWRPALNLWLARLQGPPDKVGEQLERVVAALRQHEAELPDEEDLVKADYLIARNSLDQVPGKLLGLTIPNRPNEKDALLRQSEFYVASLMWRISWEHERHQRILRAAFEGDQQQVRQARECGGLIVDGLARPRTTLLAARGKRHLAQLRAAQLKAALRWYQAKNGKLPDTLDALVPHYLPSIPADPFDDKPFRYRLSHGEEIGWVDVENVAGAPAQPGMPGGAPGGMPAAPAMPGGPPGAAAAAQAIPVMPDADVLVPAVPKMPAAPAAAGAGGPGIGGPGMPAPPGEMAGGGAPGMLGMFGVPQFPTRPVPKGQGILWSVGEDGHDDGGVKQSKNSGAMFGEDIIFLVPPPPK